MRAEGAHSRSDDAPAPRTWLDEHARNATGWIAAADPDALAAFLVMEGDIVALAAAQLRAKLDVPTGSRPTEVAEGRWIGIREVARLTNRSLSWIRHAPRDAIPGRRQNGPGCRAEWWEPAVRAWLEGLATPQGGTGGAC